MFTFVIDSLIVAATLYLTMAVYALTRPPSIATRLFFLVMSICCIWAISYHQELCSSGLETKLGWLQFRLLVLPALPVLWLMTCAELTGQRRHIPPWVWTLLFVVPFVTVLLVFSMPTHTWFLYGFALAPEAATPRSLLFRTGPWGFIFELFCIALGLVCIGLLAGARRIAPSPLRKPLLLLLLSSLFPIAGALFFSLRPTLFSGMNPAPLLLFPAAGAMALAIFKSNLLHLVPVARELLFDHIHDGIIVADTSCHVMDMNANAEKMLGLRAEDLLGKHCDFAPAPWPDALKAEDPPTRAFCYDAEKDGPWYERTRIQVLLEGRRRGWMFIFQNITAQILLHRQRLSEVRCAEETKRARQWAMLLRDLHDGIGSISANIGLLAELGQKAPTAQERGVVLAQIAELANEGNIEVRTMMNSLEARDMSWSDLFIEIRRFALLVLEPRGIRFSLNVQGPPEGEPGMIDGTSIFRIAKEAVTNAVKHAQPNAVEIEFRFGSATLELFIRDDGRWQAGRPEGRGLRHLRQRVQDMGGTFLLQTTPATQLFCLLPRPGAKPGNAAAPHEGTPT